MPKLNRNGRLILAFLAILLLAAGTVGISVDMAAEDELKTFPIFPYLHPALDGSRETLTEAYQRLSGHLPASAHPQLDAARQAYLDLYAVDSEFNRQFMSHLYGWEFRPDDGAINASRIFLRPDAEIRKIENYTESLLWAQAKPDSPCTLEGLPDEYDIFAVTTYSGKTAVNLQLGCSGNQVREADVAVGHAEKPVVLVLNSYGPTVWSIRRTPQTKIVGVIACGFLKQAIKGVPLSVPTVLITLEGKECPDYEGVDYKQLYSYAVENILGKKWQDIRAVVKKADGRTFWVPSPKAVGTAKTVASNERQVADEAGQQDIPAGKRGIEKLIALGRLRSATEADIDAWIDIASKPYRRYDPDYKVETTLSKRDAVVVQKPFTLPSGLRGSNAYSFIIPEGLQPPQGHRGHNRYYFMKSGQCTGGACCDP